MLATDDAALADRARTMRLHGIGRDAWKRYTAAGSWYYEIEAAGFKDNLTDLAAAIGLVQLGRAAELRAARAAHRGAIPRRASRISRGTGAWRSRRRHGRRARLAPLRRPPRRGGPTAVTRWTSTCPGSPASRRHFASSRHGAPGRSTRSASAGIGTSVHFIPLHLHPLYARMGYRPGQFPAAEAAYAGAISLPIWPGMSDDQIDRVDRRE